MFCFSPQLIKKTIKVFQEENKIKLTPEQAQEILENLSGLFLVYGKTVGGKRTGSLERAVPPTVAFKT